MTRVSRVYYNSSGGGDTGAVVNWFKQITDRVEAGTSASLSQAASDGENTMKHLIATRGTAKSGKAGRIDTGEMYSAVTSSFNRTGKGNAVARFGWLKERKDYYGFQEAGFDHVNGVTVEGMYAMTDAYELIRKQLAEDLKRGVRGA